MWSSRPRCNVLGSASSRARIFRSVAGPIPGTDSEAAAACDSAKVLRRLDAERGGHLDHPARRDPEEPAEADELRARLVPQRLQLCDRTRRRELAQARRDTRPDPAQLLLAPLPDELHDRRSRVADRRRRTPIRASGVRRRLRQIEESGERLELRGHGGVVELRGHLRRSVHRRLRRVRMSAVVGTSVVMEIKAFDHVALWVTARDRLAAVLTECCAMHEIERTEDFTLVGGDARRGKLTLFDADGPRERGVLERVTLRVPDLEDARARLGAAGLEIVEREGVACVDSLSELPLGLVAGDDPADLDHVVLRVRDPSTTASELESMGLERENGALHVAGKRVVLRDGGAEEPARPLLNHLAFLVDAADLVEDEARERGLEIDRVVDAENTRAVFVWGPDRIRLEYVEHKPGFSLV